MKTRLTVQNIKSFLNHEITKMQGALEYGGLQRKQEIEIESQMQFANKILGFINGRVISNGKSAVQESRESSKQENLPAAEELTN